jgi:hypothetical protein
VPSLSSPALPKSPGSSFESVFERLVAKVGAAIPPPEMARLHAAFEQRTGAFGPDDPWFESRSRAFWDDVMTRQPGSTAPILEGAEGGEEPWALALRRSHRGLFLSRTDHGALVLSDILSGAELLVHEVDEASRDSLASNESVFDGTVVALSSGESGRLALLPGSIFHLEGAEEAIAHVIAAARARGIANGALQDALLRMELSLRTLSRVKPSYAYRPEALTG